MTNFDETWLNTLIASGTEESTKLEFKAGPALTDKKEIRKDVSAMANSAGGTIIYGLKEKKDASGNNVPDAIDDVAHVGVTKETLENIILAIDPPLPSFNIERIPLTTGGYTLVVQIPESHTVHQADDKKYYKRNNFSVTAMEDYEIRQAMNRSRHPLLKADLYFEEFPKHAYDNANYGLLSGPRLTIDIHHVGGPLAEKIMLNIEYPGWWQDGSDIRSKDIHRETLDSFNRKSYIWEPFFPAQTRQFHIPLRPDLFSQRNPFPAIAKVFLWADSSAPQNFEFEVSEKVLRTQ